MITKTKCASQRRMEKNTTTEREKVNFFYNQNINLNFTPKANTSYVIINSTQSQSALDFAEYY